MSIRVQELRQIVEIIFENEKEHIKSQKLKKFFMLIFQKIELAPFFKYYAGIPQDKKILDKKMTLEGFRSFLTDIQKETYNSGIYAQFFSQISAHNLFNMGNLKALALYTHIQYSHFLITSI